MNFFLRIFCFIALPFTCIAMEQYPAEVFKSDFAHRITKFQEAHLSIQALDEKTAPAYFGQKTSDFRIGEIKKLFYFCDRILATDFDTTTTKININPQDTISQHMFLLHCKNIFLIKALHSEKDRFRNESKGKEDIVKALDAFSIYENYFSENEIYLSQFLKIEPLLKAKNIKFYQVKINLWNIHYFQKRQVINLQNILKIIDCRELRLPKKYELYLKDELHTIEEELNEFLKPLSSLRDFLKDKQNYEFDLAVYSQNTKEAKLYIDELIGIIFKSHDELLLMEKFVFNFLNIEFRCENETCALSDEDKQKNWCLFQQLLEKRMNTASAEFKEELSKQKKKQAISHQNKTKRSKKNRNITTNISSPPKSDQSSPKVVKLTAEEDKLLNNEISTEPYLTTTATTSTTAPRIEENKNEENKPETSTTHVYQWLDDIMERSKNKEGQYFAICHKAYKCQRDLISHPEILDEIQQATQNLALYLQKVEQDSSANKNPRIVPEKLAPDFDYFIHTPICYLKELRMGFIKTLFDALGVEIDTRRDGSRVHFSFNSHKTSIHVSDKKNGEIDSGAISSLRQFLLDIGWMTKY